MKNLLIIGDSLACPRPWVGIGFSQTYASLLHKDMHDQTCILNLAAGSKSTKDYLSDSFDKTYIASGDIHYLVVQLGIVDCAPRLLSRFERLLGFLCGKLEALKAIFAYYIEWKSKHRLFFTRWFPMTVVKPDNYQQNMQKIIEAFCHQNPIEKVVLVNIAYPGASLLAKSWGILENIKAYNNILDNLAMKMPDQVLIVDLYSATEKNRHWITEDDGHHVTADAHSWIASKIGALLIGLSPNSP